jgi:hypothetical protein
MTRADAPRVIVCEPTPRWAVLLRHFAPELQVSEARSLPLADDMLQAMPDSVIAVAVTGGNAADVLLRFSLWQRGYPECVTAALLDDADEDLEQALRESGAQLIVYSLFELPQLARLAQRPRAMRRLRSARQGSR